MSTNCYAQPFCRSSRQQTSCRVTVTKYFNDFAFSLGFKHVHTSRFSNQISSKSLSLKSASVGLFIFRASDFTGSAMSALSYPRNCSLITSDLNNVVLSGFMCGSPLVATTSLNFFFSPGVESPLEPSSPNCLMVISACLGSASKLTAPSFWYGMSQYKSATSCVDCRPVQCNHHNETRISLTMHPSNKSVPLRHPTLRNCLHQPTTGYPVLGVGLPRSMPVLGRTHVRPTFVCNVLATRAMRVACCTVSSVTLHTCSQTRRPPAMSRTQLSDSHRKSVRDLCRRVPALTTCPLLMSFCLLTSCTRSSLPRAAAAVATACMKRYSNRCK